MRKLLQPVRFGLVLLYLIFYLACVSILGAAVRRRWRKVALANKFLKYSSRVCLRILNVKVNPIGEANLPPAGTGALLVGNHLSYLDVLVVSSRTPACFVTSVEVRDTPGLGFICKSSGCLFVERRNKMNLRGEVAEITEGLEHGLRVAIFPEATSTNGEQILRFRRPLYVAAVEAGAPVIPFCLNYRTVGGQPISTRTRDQVFWYGDMDFVPHLWALSGSGGVKVDLHFRAQLAAQHGVDATYLAERSQAEVESVFIPVREKTEGPASAGPSA